jgi:DNA-binding CsgD family transcriptional regulator
MQMQLPIFPVDTKLVNNTLGILSTDEMVYYLHNGSPVFCHPESNINHYRFICGNLVANGLCTASELADALGVTRRSIERYAKKHRESDGDAFLVKPDRRGQCFKMTPKVLAKTQELLDQGLNKEEIARQLNISSSSIRNHIKKGGLKKKNHPPLL